MGQVNPFTVRALAHLGLSDEGYRSKAWDEFATPDAPPLDFVFTVCDKAAGEVCPVWPGQPISAHWGMPDPAAVTGSDDEKLRAFLDAAYMLKRRIELMLALPFNSLDQLSLRQAVRGIGQK